MCVKFETSIINVSGVIDIRVKKGNKHGCQIKTINQQAISTHVSMHTVTEIHL